MSTEHERNLWRLEKEAEYKDLWQNGKTWRDRRFGKRMYKSLVKIHRYGVDNTTRMARFETWFFKPRLSWATFVLTTIVVNILSGVIPKW